MPKHTSEQIKQSLLSRCTPEPMSGCWLWIGGIIKSKKNLYAQFGHGELAHRVSYELFVAPIPSGFQIDHKCRNTLCVNPKHLEPVTNSENGRRTMLAIGSKNMKPFYETHKHCGKGHEYTPANTYIRRDNKTRMCKQCGTESKRLARCLDRGYLA